MTSMQVSGTLSRRAAGSGLSAPGSAQSAGGRAPAGRRERADGVPSQRPDPDNFSRGPGRSLSGLAADRRRRSGPAGEAPRSHPRLDPGVDPFEPKAASRSGFTEGDSARGLPGTGRSLGVSPVWGRDSSDSPYALAPSAGTWGWGGGGSHAGVLPSLPPFFFLGSRSACLPAPRWGPDNKCIAHGVSEEPSEAGKPSGREKSRPDQLQKGGEVAAGAWAKLGWGGVGAWGGGEEPVLRAGSMQRGAGMCHVRVLGAYVTCTRGVCVCTRMHPCQCHPCDALSRTPLFGWGIQSST